MSRIRALAWGMIFALLGVAVGCVSWELPDLDGDGIPTGEDCDDLNADIFPGAEEVWYDGIDQNCDGANDFDRDGDGFDSALHENPDGTLGDDCWDDPGTGEDFVVVDGAGFDQPASHQVHPEATDTWYDGVDSDCDGANDFDQDGDGFDAAFHPQLDGSFGDDCVDGSELDDVYDEETWSAWTNLGFGEAEINPGAEDTCYDGINADCDSTEADPLNEGEYRNDDDCDKDGWDRLIDCDDNDATIEPNDAPDPWYDCIDANCDNNDGDWDGDRYVPDSVVDGTGVELINYVDVNSPVYCDSTQFTWHLDTGDCHDDGDSDPEVLQGFPALTSADVNPAATEVWYDGVDADCDEASDFDADGDVYESADHAQDNGGTLFGQDCDDTNAEVNPSRFENCLTAFDDNCDGSDNDQGGFACANFYTDADGDTFGVGNADCRCQAYDLFTSSNNTDCEDGDATVFPQATELCDGQDNNCSRSGSLDGIPLDEVDNDGDATVECALDAGGWDGTTAVTAWEDCDDGDVTIHPAAPEICDGQDNDCDLVLPIDEIDNDTDGHVECSIHFQGWDGTITTGFSNMSGGDCDDGDAFTFPGAASSESVATACRTDADLDSYGDVSPASAVTAGTDCDDGDSTIHPTATELCDGQDNDCNNSLPAVEDDDDSDGYVECTIDSGGWDTSPSKQGDDCVDTDATIFPTAPEICDGLDNDCNVAIPNNEIDNDADGHVECTLHFQGWDGSITSGFSTMSGDDCDDAHVLTYPGAAPLDSTTACMRDVDLDDYGDDNPSAAVTAGTDCLDTDDTVSPADSEICDGQDNNCSAGVPANETDNDGDGYVECTIDSGGWDDSPSKQGDDCDDGDSTIHPTASELCDGQDNDCNNSLPAVEDDDDADGYVECTIDSGGWDTLPTKLGDDCNDNGDSPLNLTIAANIHPTATEICDGLDNDCNIAIPNNEIDNDADGHVECTIHSQGWWGSITSGFSVMSGDDCDDAHVLTYPGAAPLDSTTACMRDVDLDDYGDDNPSSAVTPGTDCLDTDDTVSPADSEICDGQDNNCSAGVPANETDNDGDGYVECTIDSGGWNGTGLHNGGDDCVDSDSTIHPTATEICDGLDNDCNNSLPTNEVDNDSDDYVECTIDSGGWDASPVKLGGDCLDSDATVSPGDSEICDGQNNDCSAGVPANETDNDGDGYVECTIDSGGWDASPAKLGDDCDDTTAARDPGNNEICDGSNVDEDCDTLSDDNDPSATGQTTWYRDVDADGFGKANPNQDKCDQPSGYVGNSTDCDDADASVFPSATELCDGQLNNCSSTLPSNETDDDGDGYVECTLDSGGWDASPAKLGDDCNDGAASISPSGSEICDSSDVDEDCDGLSDDDDPSATGQTAWYTDSDSDGYGDESATASQACNQPTGQAATNDDCDDTDSGVNLGATEVCDASATDEDCNNVADDNDSGVTGTTDYYTDFDADGEGDEDATAQSLCIQPSGTVADNSDCDDSESGINTSATEVSNEEDDDCDDLVDEGFRNAGDLVLTEVEGNPAGFSSDQSQGQWLEVYNPSTTTDHHMGGYVVLSNCDGSGGFSSPSLFFYVPVDGLTVGAGDYAVLCKSASAAGGNCDYVYGSDVNDSSSVGATFHADFNIATGSCRIQLFMPFPSQEVDRVLPRDGALGTSTWPTKETGVAFCLDPSQLTASANDLGSNWGYPATTEIYDATNSNYGTPGTAASTCTQGTWSP